MLRYTVEPDEVPYSRPGTNPTVVALRLRITNTGADAVALDHLEFALDPGDGGDRLTSEQEVGGIVAAAAGTTQWYARADGAGTFSAVPWRRDFRLEPGGSITFDLAGVAVNTEPGTAHLNLGDGTALAIRKVAAPPRIVEFTGVPAEIEVGQESVLEWETVNAGACTLTTPDGTERVGLDGTLPVSPADTYTYTLVAEGDGRPATRQFTVTVADIAIAEFTATPRRVAGGDPVTLSWRIHNAASATIDPGRIPVDEKSGTLLVPRVDADTTFQLTARRGRHAPAVASTSVTVMPVELRRLAAEPAVVRAGEESTLRWDAAWATGYRLAWLGGAVDLPRGATEYPVRPAATTAYTLTARGRDERTDDTMVTVGPAITRLTLTTDPARPGRLGLHWQARVGPVRLGTGPTDQPRMVDVADGGDTWITLEPKSTFIRVESGARSTIMRLVDVEQNNGWRLGLLDLAAAAGFAGPGSKARVDWATHGTATTQLRVSDGPGEKVVKGYTGGVDVRVGPHPPWSGQLVVEHRPDGATYAVTWQSA
ncbi:hypothetical protein [Dactylosporangium sp. NPDC051541]|uniref:hypothetical protein n=1 Tax=Dactylosporangium sp. NPDC051541 TaxID=3363977 RepID=UPI0037A21D2D